MHIRRTVSTHHTQVVVKRALIQLPESVQLQGGSGDDTAMKEDEDDPTFVTCQSCNISVHRCELYSTLPCSGLASGSGLQL